jgi:glycosyltransferase involved in cell wall biosynthesis
MTLIHVEDFFDPKSGYQINELLYASRKLEHNIYLITSDSLKPMHKEVNDNEDLAFENATGIKIIRKRLLFEYSGRVILKGLFKEIDKIHPDVVFFHGIADFKDLSLLKGKKRYLIYRDCHMSWVASINKFRKIFFIVYRAIFAKMINSTEKYSKIFALGCEEYEYLRILGINEEKISFLRHGYNHEIMFYDEHARFDLRESFGINKNEILIAYIGKFDYFKRPDLIFDVMNELRIEYRDNIKILFLGPKDDEYYNLFNQKLAKFYNPNCVIVEESKDFNELRKYYSASDICIFPKQTTLSAIHAQVCGCIVMMENHKSNIERNINIDYLFSQNDLLQASKILEKIINSKDYSDRYNNISLALEKFKDREYSNQIKYIFQDILQKENA